VRLARVVPSWGRKYQQLIGHTREMAFKAFLISSKRSGDTA
jgi:hypothetical protein